MMNFCQSVEVEKFDKIWRTVHDEEVREERNMCRGVPDIRYYPVSGQESGIRLDLVQNDIWYYLVSCIW